MSGGSKVAQLEEDGATAPWDGEPDADFLLRGLEAVEYLERWGIYGKNGPKGWCWYLQDPAHIAATRSLIALAEYGKESEYAFTKDKEGVVGRVPDPHGTVRFLLDAFSLIDKPTIKPLLVGEGRHSPGQHGGDDETEDKKGIASFDEVLRRAAIKGK
jgi:hypothetical protein